MRQKKYLSPNEIAEVLGISADKVIDLIRAGKLKAINVATGDKRARYRVAPEDFQAFLEQQAVKPKANIVPTQRRRKAKLEKVTRYSRQFGA